MARTQAFDLRSQGFVRTSVRALSVYVVIVVYGEGYALLVGNVLTDGFSFLTEWGIFSVCTRCLKKRKRVKLTAGIEPTPLSIRYESMRTITLRQRVCCCDGVYTFDI